MPLGGGWAVTGLTVWEACKMRQFLPVSGVGMRGYKGGPAPVSFSLHPHFPLTFHLALLLSF